jgi:hypothetical protein
LSDDPRSIHKAVRVGASAAICALQRTGEGRYKILAFRGAPHDGVQEAVKALRRELAETLTAKSTRVMTAGEAAVDVPEYAGPPASNSHEWRANVTQREEQGEQAAKARLAELDALGARFAAKSDGTPDLGRVWDLLKGGHITAINANERRPLHWLRTAFEGGVSPGVYGAALARAIAAADAGARRGGLRR